MPLQHFVLKIDKEEKDKKKDKDFARSKMKECFMKEKYFFPKNEVQIIFNKQSVFTYYMHELYLISNVI